MQTGFNGRLLAIKQIRNLGYRIPRSKKMDDGTVNRGERKHGIVNLAVLGHLDSRVSSRGTVLRNHADVSRVLLQLIVVR